MSLLNNTVCGVGPAQAENSVNTGHQCCLRGPGSVFRDRLCTAPLHRLCTAPSTVSARLPPPSPHGSLHCLCTAPLHRLRAAPLHSLCTAPSTVSARLPSTVSARPPSTVSARLPSTVHCLSLWSHSIAGTGSTVSSSALYRLSWLHVSARTPTSPSGCHDCVSLRL